MIRSIRSSILFFLISLNFNVFATEIDKRIFIDKTTIQHASQVSVKINDEDNGEDEKDFSKSDENNLLLYHPSDEVKKEIPDNYPVFVEKKIVSNSIAELKMNLINEMVTKKYFSDNQRAILQNEFITDKDNNILVELKDKNPEKKEVLSIKEENKDVSQKHSLAGNFVILMLLLLISFELRKTWINRCK